MTGRPSLPYRFASWMIENRGLLLGTILLMTAVFLYGVANVEVKTLFNDMLPQKHPYMKTHLEYQEQLGDPLKVYLMLRVKEGDIYSGETLEKVKRITDEIDLIKGVNHNQVYSIASRKIKKITVNAEGIFTENLIKEVPRTEEALDQLRETVRSAHDLFGIWVSRDEKAALFTAAFIGELVDYNNLFDEIARIIETETDDNTIIHAAGEPILTGWVYSYRQQMILIFALTFLALFALLFLYFRNVVGVVVPVLSTVVGGVWGLGFCGLLGLNLDPLTLVIPLLITARALSHSVQIVERYFECYEELKDVKAACVECASSILPPGILGITTDGLGILLIAVAPIPIMQKLAYICGFWAFSIVITGLIFTPIVISFFRPPNNIADIVDMDKGFAQKILSGIARLGYGKAGIFSFGIGIVLFIVCGSISLDVRIGDVNPGTPILWKDSEYNRAIDQLNAYFLGTEELYVIVEGDEDRIVEQPQVLRLLAAFQQHMENSPLVAGSQSVADMLPTIRKYVYGGYPKWQVLPEASSDSAQAYYLLMGGAAPGDFDRYFSGDKRNANIIVWYKDHMGDTIRNAIAWAKLFIHEQNQAIADAGVRFRLASGNIGMLAAINETVMESQFLNYILVLVVVFLLCSLTYRSMVAAIILMIPLNLANVITTCIMKWLGIRLNINTLPIVSVGVGVGIDYGIYLLSRICEEYHNQGEYSFPTAVTSIKTTGKAIFFTATTMIAGVIFWYFFSSLRFQAEMGLLLALIMFINMIGALVLIPSLVSVFKPKFLGKVKLLIKE